MIMNPSLAFVATSRMQTPPAGPRTAPGRAAGRGLNSLTWRLGQLRGLLPHHRWLPILLGAVGWLCAPAFSALEAQVATTAATSVRNPDGRCWAYLTWASDQPEFLQRAVIAVYRKDGPPESSGDYRLVSLVNRTVDPAVIRAGLRRAEQLGENLDMVNDLVQSAFGNLVPAPALPLEDKLRLVFTAAQGIPEMGQTLQFLVRSQPAIAVAAGQAFVAEVPSGSPSTFELRVCDRIPTNPGTECTTVMGRVTVVGGVGAPLPAPGIPTDVSWRGPRGDLNVRLLWATPDALRAESLLQAGFQIYRVTPAAQAAHFAVRVPAPGELSRLSQTEPAAVIRVSRQPAFPEQTFNEAEVAGFRARRETGDVSADLPGESPIPYNAVDDNLRYDPGGQPFRDGEQFYYYVVARDLLGREGVASPAALITICGRLAPIPPREVAVEVASSFNPADGKADQFFKIRWSRNPTNSAAVPTDSYLLYRWNSPEEVTTPPPGAPNPPLKEIPAGDRSTLVYEADEDSPSRPMLPLADQKTYWYTVRAVRSAPCGDRLLSGHSPPVPGVLRGWNGPARASGEISTFCLQPQVEFVSWANVSSAPSPFSLQELELICQRTPGDRTTVWVEYYLAALDQPDPAGVGLEGDRYLGRVWFRTGETVSTLRARIPRSDAVRWRVRCRVGAAHGAVSPVADGVIGPIANAWSRSQATFRSLPVRGERTALGDCGPHATVDPETGRIQPIGIAVHYAGTMREHRIYAAIDNGPLSLVARGTNNPPVTVQEWFTGFPGNSAEICFYLQNYDSQGLAGPMTLLACVRAQGQQQLPIPMPAPPQGATAPDGRSTVATLKWFCPPFAVERFRVLIGTADPSLLPSQISSSLYSARGVRLEIVDGKTYRIYETGRVGGDFSRPGDTTFTAVVEVNPAVEYTFLVQAVSAPDDRGRTQMGGFSQPVQFQWSPAPFAGDAPVVWPARGLLALAPLVGGGGVVGVRPPPPERLFNPQSWTDADSGRFHLGVQIGEVRGEIRRDPQSGAPTLEGVVDPQDLLGAAADDDPLLRPAIFPGVLYRYQVPNDAFPRVSGDVIQVSPLMRAIAHRTVIIDSLDRTAFLDPFVDLRAVPAGPASIVRFYLKDTQPAVQEATYRYVLVHFTEQGEVDNVTHSDAITIP